MSAVGRPAGDPLILPEEVTERARRMFRLGQLQGQGYFGGRITEAWAHREVTCHRGRFLEQWLFYVAPDDTRGSWCDHDSAARVISRSRFSISSYRGPVVIGDRMLPARIGSPETWARGALDSVEVVSHDYTPPEPLPDDEFWSLISELGGSVHESAVERLVDALSGLSLDQLCRYQDSVDRRLFALDRPENTVAYVDDPGVVDGESSLMYRCEILARGREAYEGAVLAPRRGKPGVDGVSTPEFLYAIEELTPWGMPQKSWPVVTGSNPAFWPDARPLRKYQPSARPEGGWPGPFSQEVQLSALGLGTHMDTAVYGFVSYLVREDQVREVVGCTTASSERLAREEIVSFLSAPLDDEGWQLVGSVVHEEATTPSLGTPLARIERRGRGAIEDYIHRYVNGRE